MNDMNYKCRDYEGHWSMVPKHVLHLKKDEPWLTIQYPNNSI
jgi:hypothetical protein